MQKLGAIIQTGNTKWKKYGCSDENERGERLLGFATAYTLNLRNARLEQKPMRKWR